MHITNDVILVYSKCLVREVQKYQEDPGGRINQVEGCQPGGDFVGLGEASGVDSKRQVVQQNLE